MKALLAAPQRGRSGGSARFQKTIGSMMNSSASIPPPMIPSLPWLKRVVAIETPGPSPSQTGSGKRP